MQRPLRRSPTPEGIDFSRYLPPFAPTDAATRWLFALTRRGMQPGLERARLLLERLGQPQHRFPSIVVVGTNGKGSATLCLEALGRAAGLRTGAYTSPHLLSPTERILVEGSPVTPAQLAALVDQVRDAAEETGATYFETMTVMAVLHFAQSGVELAVMETGLGGRLDATNAVDGRAALLTSIGLDHADVLGETLEQILVEKLGVARPGQPFYLGALDSGLTALAHRHLRDVGAIPIDVTRSALALHPAPITGRPRGQARTAALATACFQDLADRFDLPKPGPRALATVRTPARYEQYGHEPPLWVDTAHNAPALKQLLHQWDRDVPWERRILVLAAMRDKRLEEVLPQLAASAPVILTPQVGYHRARPARELAANLTALAPSASIEVHGVTEDALERARTLAHARGASVLVTGSNFLVAEALDRLGVDDLFARAGSPLWDQGLPLRRREGGRLGVTA